MLFSCAVDYVNALIISKNRGTSKAKAALIVSIVVNLSLLAFFKYSDFAISIVNSIFNTNIALLHIGLPIGISFYTFQTMSYTIDVYRNEAPAQKNITNLGTFVTLFPQLVAGPIVRYSDIARDLNTRTHTFDKMYEGVYRLIIGLSKKVILANNLGAVWFSIKATPYSELSNATAWLGIICFTLQIYFDFSGYSDMAIGLGKILGFEFLENFNYPYISKSITEFWRRWHMSLG
ncbi:MBOAT family O-acyltransferase, partial [Romboutsia sp.]|uniref:MBOAT family O-acyltransferase n=1 Tax=Romboutsia sp. TaxID=1965302 RepID=UPI003F66FCBD